MSSFDVDDVHTSPGEFENGGFPLKTRQIFSVHITPEEFKNAAIIGQVGFVFKENPGREITRLCHDVIVFEERA